MIETNEIIIKASNTPTTNTTNSNQFVPEFNRDKPLQLVMGDNKVIKQVNLAKSIEVRPKREVISYLKMNK